VKLILDTQLLLWIGVGEKPERNTPVSAEVLLLIAAPDSELYFSSVSVWEIAIKFALGRPQFRIEPHLFRRTLLDCGYSELAITGEHGAAVSALPPHHKDPFDRLLVAQAMVERITLLTVDATLTRYGAMVRQV